jgi:DNA repair protein RadC
MTNLMVRSATGRYRRACKSEVLEVAAQHLAASLQRSVSRPLTSPDAVQQFLVQALAPRDAEIFCIMFLDNRHRLIQFDEVFRGTIDGHRRTISETYQDHGDPPERDRTKSRRRRGQ